MASTLDRPTFAAEDANEYWHDTNVEQLANRTHDGVVEGCDVSFDAADLTFDIASGYIKADGVPVAVSAQANAATLVADSSNKRWALIGLDASGNAVLVSGDPAADASTEPTKPELGSIVVVLYEVKIEAGQTVANDISVKIDKRMPVSQDFGGGADIASASSLSIPAGGGHYFQITGTTTITAIQDAPRGWLFEAHFAGALSLTHNATSFILQGGIDVSVSAGDVGLFVSEGGGNWRLIRLATTPHQGPATTWYFPGMSSTANVIKRVIPVWNGSAVIDRVVVVEAINTAAVSLYTLKRIGNNWVFDPDTEDFDDSITVQGSDFAYNKNFFAMRDPAGFSGDVLFVVHMESAGNTFAVDSISLPQTGQTSLTATAATISGANEPGAATDLTMLCTPIDANSVLGIYEDDSYVIDLSESGGTFTFDFGTAPVTAIDTDINVIADTGELQWSMTTIGSQIFLLWAGIADVAEGTAGNRPALWELDNTGALVEAWEPFTCDHLRPPNATLDFPSQVFPVGGSFGIATPMEAGGAFSPYIATSFPIDSL